MTGRLILVRHGHAAGGDGRCIGHEDIPLASQGADAVRALAGRWSRDEHRPARIVSSDLLRARESAHILAATWGLDATTDARLREMSFGNWDGRRWDDIHAVDVGRVNAWSADWIHLAPPDGESGVQLAERARAALDDLLPLAMNGRDVVIVGHAGWIRVAATLLLREPLTATFDRSIDYARAAIFTVDVDGGLVALSAWNADRVD